MFMLDAFNCECEFASLETDCKCGFHRFKPDLGLFEVFWTDGDSADFAEGFYWWACFPGCLPDGEPVGPFNSSKEAYEDARPC